MRNFDLFSLRLFVTVCETGNMRRAAEMSNLVPSAVSKRLAQLEDAVGATLLLRKRHGVTPTPAGETLLEHARSMLVYADRIERDMARHAAGVQGRVNVLATASVMAESLADQIAQFLQQSAHKNIQVDLEERISPEVIRGIQEGVASIGICWDAADTHALQTATYGYDHLCVVVPSGHPLAQRKSVRFEETLEFEHVIMPINSAVEVMMQRQASWLGKRLRYRVIVTNFEAALRVVHAGLAITVVPREVAALQAALQPGTQPGARPAAQPTKQPAEPAVSSGHSTATPHGLVMLALDEPWSRRRFVVCHRGEDTLNPAALQLLRFLTLKAPPP